MWAKVYNFIQNDYSVRLNQLRYISLLIRGQIRNLTYFCTEAQQWRLYPSISPCYISSPFTIQPRSLNLSKPRSRLCKQMIRVWTCCERFSAVNVAYSFVRTKMPRGSLPPDYKQSSLENAINTIFSPALTASLTHDWGVYHIS